MLFCNGLRPRWTSAWGTRSPEFHTSTTSQYINIIDTIYGEKGSILPHQVSNMSQSFYTAAGGAETATCVIKPVTNRLARKSDGMHQGLKELK